MKKLVLNYKGRDSWSRPVYECGGKLYVDVDPRKDRKPDICTKQWHGFRLCGTKYHSVVLNDDETI